MNRLIVFDRRDKAAHHGYEIADRQPDKVTFYPSALRLRYENGDLDMLAVIASESDSYRYRGLVIHDVDFRSPVPPICRDELRAMIRPLPKGGNGDD